MYKHNVYIINNFGRLESLFEIITTYNVHGLENLKMNNTNKMIYFAGMQLTAVTKIGS